MHMINTLSALVSEIRGCSLIHNDRGNGCGGPGKEDATEVLHAIESGGRADEVLTASEEPEEWELAREAYRAHGLNPAGISAVYVGDRKAGTNGHQMVYAV